MPKLTRIRVLSSSAVPLPDGTPIPEAKPIEIPEPQPPIGHCDFLLGQYMRNWNYVESEISELFQQLLGAHSTAAHIILSAGINAQTLREIMTGLGGQRLSKNDCERLETLLDRVKRATTKRNKIVHGQWRIVIKGHGSTQTATWERYTAPTDPRLNALMNDAKGSQKIRDAYIFSIERLGHLAEEAHKLSHAIKEFRESAKFQPFPNAAPVFS